MHEYAVAKNILKVVIEEAARNDALKVLEIRLAIGELSSFEGESVRMYFDVLAEDTIANGAKIIIRKINAGFYCKECNLTYSHDRTDYDCPKCGEIGVFDGTGKEFLIESIEIE